LFLNDLGNDHQAEEFEIIRKRLQNTNYQDPKQAKTELMVTRILYASFLSGAFIDEDYNHDLSDSLQEREEEEGKIKTNQKKKNKKKKPKQEEERKEDVEEIKTSDMQDNEKKKNQGIRRKKS